MLRLLKAGKARLTRATTIMGALYEDVEKFFGDIFARFGVFLATYPVVFIIVSLLTSLLLGTGLVGITYEYDVEKLYTPMGSPAHRDRDVLERYFPDHTRDAFYPHQLLHMSTFGEVIVRSRSPEEEGVLQEHIILEVQDLYKRLLDITLDSDDRGMTYGDLCAERGERCVVDGLLVIEEFLRNDNCLNATAAQPYTYTDQTGYAVDIRDVLSEIAMQNHCMQATAMRLRLNLKHDTERQRMLSLHWERKFLAELGTHEYEYIDVAYAASDSLDIELADHLGDDGKFFSLTIIIMVVYATIVSSGGNWVSTRMLLAQSGIFATLLAILASFGLLSMCGLQFVDIGGVMPFLVLGVGLDDMFILMTGWRRTNVNFPIADRASETFRSSAISVTITSLTNILAFCIGATSPFLAVRNFCIFSGVAMLFCYINQLTFFGGCMMLHARRVNASRHCVTCKPTLERSALSLMNKGRLEVLCCSGHPPKVQGEDDSFCEKIPHTFLPRFLMQNVMKVLVFVLFVIYLVFSVWGASQIKAGLKLENVVPDSSYLSKYIGVQERHFAKRGPYVMFVVMEPVDYEREDVQRTVDDVLWDVTQSGYAHDEFSVSWLMDYVAYLERDPVRHVHPRRHEAEWVHHMRTRFLPHHPEYANDIYFSEDGERIAASRFYCSSNIFNDSTQETAMMQRMREIANTSTNAYMIAFSPDFVYYEHYVSILKNTLLAVGVAIIGMLFIALMFIPHPISITCVTVTMITIVLGMFGFMHFWGLELSAITNVQIILSVGFCVDFTIHISHAFMAATGKNRNERVVAALEKVGIPILNAAFTSILGILMLGFASSYAFKSFFKTMVLVIALGLFHSLMVLPVILSFIGPRRTSRPRVFIPISPNAKLPGEENPFGGGRRHHTDSTGDRHHDHHHEAAKPPPSSSIELLEHGAGTDEQKGLLCITEEPPRQELFSGLHDHYGAFTKIHYPGNGYPAGGDSHAYRGGRPPPDVDGRAEVESCSSGDTVTDYHETSQATPVGSPMLSRRWENRLYDIKL